MVVYVIDLFCGAGGFSTGALAFGAKPVVAVDHDPSALSIHKKNHPNTKHLCMELGGDPEKTYLALTKHIPSLRKGDSIHCHASPPCQNLSNGNHYRDTAKGLALTEWTLKFLKRYFGNATWSMEQVNHAKLRNFLAEQRDIYWQPIDMSLYGVPQSRKRIIVSNVDYMAHLQKLKTSLHDVVKLPRGTKFIGNCNTCQTRLDDLELRKRFASLRDAKNKDLLSYTMTHLGINFIDKSYKIIRYATLEECALLQTFPKDYFADTQVQSNKLKIYVGNALPPAFVKNLMQAICACRNDQT